MQPSPPLLKEKKIRPEPKKAKGDIAATAPSFQRGCLHCFMQKGEAAHS